MSGWSKVVTVFSLSFIRFSTSYFFVLSVCRIYTAVYSPFPPNIRCVMQSSDILSDMMVADPLQALLLILSVLSVRQLQRIWDSCHGKYLICRCIHWNDIFRIICVPIYIRCNSYVWRSGKIFFVRTICHSLSRSLLLDVQSYSVWSRDCSVCFSSSWNFLPKGKNELSLVKESFGTILSRDWMPYKCGLKNKPFPYYNTPLPELRPGSFCWTVSFGCKPIWIQFFSYLSFCKL